MIKTLISIIVLFTFVVSMICPPGTVYAQMVSELPAPGTMISPSKAFVPVMLRAVKIDPKRPLVFDFIVDSGNTNADQAIIKTETQKLVKYFLATLTIPEKDLWVNLSPFEHDRIVPEAFGQTQMGRDLLAQDYVLKELTSSLIYPEKALGKEFWSHVYAKAQEMYGSTEVPINTFNKVWIMPDQAEVFEINNMAIIGKCRMKVLMEEDYLSLQKHSNNRSSSMDQLSHKDMSTTSKLSSQIMREIVLPEIEKEVNTGKNFARLRQVYQALVLATWYKNNLKASLLGQVYANQKKVKGVDVADKSDKEKIYQRYIRAYKRGVFNYIKEEKDPLTNDVLPRKYFSGGAAMMAIGFDVQRGTHRVSSPQNIPSYAMNTEGKLSDVTVDAAAMSPEVTADNMERFRNDPKLNPTPMSLPNLAYGSALWEKWRKGSQRPIIGQNFIASSFIPKSEQRTRLGVLSYRHDFRKEEYRKAARNVILSGNVLNAGASSSFIFDKEYLESVGRSKPGSKGSDLYFYIDVPGYDEHSQPTIHKKVPVSITELKYLQAIAARHQYSRTEIRDLVNADSYLPIEQLLEHTVYLEDRFDFRPGAPKRLYKDALAEAGVELGTLEGVYYPKVDVATGLLTNKYKAGAGHGRLATEILRGTLTADIPGEGTDHEKTVIDGIWNGDGANNSPNPYIVGGMVAKNYPIVIITSPRTEADSKGGLIGERDGAPDLLELAQAKGDEEKKLFEAAGLDPEIGGEVGTAVFNTNISLCNRNILKPLLNELYRILGDEKKFAEVTSPELIANDKIENDGTKTIQLEGASVSTYMTLQRFFMTSQDARVQHLWAKYKRKYGIEFLVYEANLDEEMRDETFTPNKYVFDHMVYSSSHFRIDVGKSWRLINNHAGHNPGFYSNNPFYNNPRLAREAFGNFNVIELTKLSITGGVVTMPDAQLIGEVSIENRSGHPVDLNDFNTTRRFQDSEFEQAQLDPNLLIHFIQVRRSVDLRKRLSLGSNTNAIVVLNTLIHDPDSWKIMGEERPLNPEEMRYRIEEEYQGAAPRGRGSELKAVLNTRKGRFTTNDHGDLLIINVHILIDEDGVIKVTDADHAELVKEDAKERASTQNVDDDIRDVPDRAAVSTNPADKASYGGIDFNPAALNLQVVRTGQGIKMQVDPAEIARIKADGVDGFTPVVVNIVPVKSMFGAVGRLLAQSAT